MTDFFYDSYLLILKFLIIGGFLGVIYDIFRFYRIARNDKTYCPIEVLKKRFHLLSKPQRIKFQISDSAIVFLEDILFFMTVAMTETLMFFQFNGGEIRIYCLLASAIGFLVYQKTVGNLLIFLSKKILYLCRFLIYWILFLFFTPCLFAYKIIQKFFCFLKKKSIRKKKDV